MPLGAGYTVEGQVTGEEVCLQMSSNPLVIFTQVASQKVGGIQIDVFPQYSTECNISRSLFGEALNVFMTPRQLGMKPSDCLYHTVSWLDLRIWVQLKLIPATV